MTVAIAVLVSWRTRFRFRWVLPACLVVAVPEGPSVERLLTISDGLGVTDSSERDRRTDDDE